jgi:hypothetical protein
MDIIRYRRSKINYIQDIYFQNTDEPILLLLRFAENIKMNIIKKIQRLNYRLDNVAIYHELDIIMLNEWLETSNKIIPEDHKVILDIRNHIQICKRSIERNLVSLDSKLEMINDLINKINIENQTHICGLKESWKYLHKMNKIRLSSELGSESFFTQFLRNMMFDIYGIHNIDKSFKIKIVNYYKNLLFANGKNEELNDMYVRYIGIFLKKRKYNIIDYRIIDRRCHKYSIPARRRYIERDFYSINKYINKCNSLDIRSALDEIKLYIERNLMIHFHIKDAYIKTISVFVERFIKINLRKYHIVQENKEIISIILDHLIS